MSEPTPPAPPPVEPPVPTRSVGRMLGGVVLVVVGVAWLLEALDVVQVPWDVFLPAGLIAIGVVLVVNARTGARHGGLVALGIVLTVLLFLGSLVSFPFGGGIGERTERPTTAAQATEGFELGIGQLTVDLTQIPSPADEAEPIVVRAKLGIGQLVVEVPEGIPVRVEAKSGLGQVRVFDREESGFDVELVSEPQGGDAVMDIRVSVGIGEVDVERG